MSLFHRSIADWLTDDAEGGSLLLRSDGRARTDGARTGGYGATNPDTVRWLPRHLMALEDWDRLAELLAEPGFLTASWDADKYFVLRVWASIERELSHRAGSWAATSLRAVRNEPKGRKRLGLAMIWQRLLEQRGREARKQFYQDVLGPEMRDPAGPEAPRAGACGGRRAAHWRPRREFRLEPRAATGVNSLRRA